jgi:hypothetical protein
MQPLPLIRPSPAIHNHKNRANPIMKYHHSLAAGICGFVLISGFASTAAAETSHQWNAFEVDFNALGLASISPTSGANKAPAEGAMGRIASYRVAFSQAGSYDLYVRWRPGSFYFSQILWRYAAMDGGQECQRPHCWRI